MTDELMRRTIANTFYANIDPRRRTEVSDARMVQEDPNAMANLSNTPIHREYPKAPFFPPYYGDWGEI